MELLTKITRLDSNIELPLHYRMPTWPELRASNLDDLLCQAAKFKQTQTRFASGAL